jgi:hypothetical protein
VCSTVARALQAEIEGILLVEGEHLGADHSALYVATRATQSEDAIIGPTLARLSQRGFELRGFELGGAELDVIDFAVSNYPHCALAVIGFVGCGKSSLIHYIFDYVCGRAPGTERIFPFLINCKNLEFQSGVHAEVLRRIGLQLYESAPLAAKLMAFDRERGMELLECLRYRGLADARARTALRRALPLLRALRESGGCPVLVLDNTDQLDSQTLSILRLLAREASGEHRLPTIMTLRPDTYRSRYETTLGEDAYIAYRVTLRRPNLADVLTRRMDAIQSLVANNQRPTFSLEYKGNTYTATRDAAILHVRKVREGLNAPATMDALWRLADGSLRGVLLMISNIAIYEEYERAIIFGKRAQPYEVGKTLSLEQLIRAQMLREVVMFGQDEDEGSLEPRSRTIPNIYQYGTSSEVNAAHKYWIMACVAATGGTVASDVVEDIAGELGVHGSLRRELVRTLIKERLLDDVEYNGQTGTLQYVWAGERCRFFLENIVHNPQYLYEVVTDNHVTQTLIARTDRMDPAGPMIRTLALIETVRKVIRAERDLVEKASSALRADILWRIHGFGLLSRRIYSATDSILETMAHSSDPEVRRAGCECRSALEETKGELEACAAEFEASIPPTRKSIKEVSEPSIRMRDAELSFALQPPSWLGGRPRVVLEARGKLGQPGYGLIALCGVTGSQVSVSTAAFGFTRADRDKQRCEIPILVMGKAPRLDMVDIRIVADGIPYCDVNWSRRDSIRSSR